MSEVPKDDALAVSAGSSLVTSRGMFGGIEQLSDEQFNARLAMLQTGIRRVKQIMKVAMIAGTHYGVPGLKTNEENEKAAASGRVGLYKAGCEMLWSMLNHAPGKPSIEITYGDPNNETSPAINVNVSAPVHIADQEGVVLATGVGNCNSMEVKYRWRDALPKCPACGAEAVFVSKYSKDGKPPGFYCSDKRGGCGAQFPAGDPAITTQPRGRTANPELFDLLNTIVKMATKRAFTDATIRAARASDLFSPDLEDMPQADRDRIKADTERRIKDMGNAVVVGGGSEMDAAVARADAREAQAKTTTAQAPASNPVALPPCPQCHKPTLMRSKYPDKDGPFKGMFGFYCKACSAKFAPEDGRILGPVGATTRETVRGDDSGPATPAQIVELTTLIDAKHGTTNATRDAALRSIHVTVNGIKARVGGFETITHDEAAAAIDLLGGLPDFSQPVAQG